MSKGGAGVNIPYAVRREIEEICKNTGQPFNEIVSGKTIQELEGICNNANYPRDSWRNRWHKTEGSFISPQK